MNPHPEGVQAVGHQARAPAPLARHCAETPGLDDDASGELCREHGM